MWAASLLKTEVQPTGWQGGGGGGKGLVGMGRGGEQVVDEHRCGGDAKVIL